MSLRHGVAACVPLFLLILLIPLQTASAGPVQYTDTVTGPIEPTGLPVSFWFDAGSELMRLALIADALAEWDAIICEEQFLLFQYAAGAITIRWEDIGGPDPDGSQTLADTNMTTREIRINTNAALNWYEGFGTPGEGQFDLLTILKHEIGHAMGVRADWGQDGMPPPPAWASDSLLMWGVFSPQEVIRAVTYNDAREIDGKYTIHPEPGTYLLLGGGLLILGVLRRRRTGARK